MLEFSQLSKPIKWQDLLEKGKKMAAMRFEQVQRFLLAKKKKKIWGLWALKVSLLRRGGISVMVMMMMMHIQNDSDFTSDSITMTLIQSCVVLENIENC